MFIVTTLVCAIYVVHNKRKERCEAPNPPIPVEGADEIAITHQGVHRDRVITVDDITTDQAEEDEHAQFE